ncbi:hypothetical protein CYR75_01175 [Paracoccus jeotgali]|uniref:Uncharacterized protein n=1 Tax=Paracoccus jeotgali TaxID=2065379 RepID=A0A2K9MBS9_9RHOB|nr:hypothetical protein CYR75_01175 [Paracoccus jeotgali]
MLSRLAPGRGGVKFTLILVAYRARLGRDVWHVGSLGLVEEWHRGAVGGAACGDAGAGAGAAGGGRGPAGRGDPAAPAARHLAGRCGKADGGAGADQCRDLELPRLPGQRCRMDAADHHRRHAGAAAGDRRRQL